MPSISYEAETKNKFAFSWRFFVLVFLAIFRVFSFFSLFSGNEPNVAFPKNAKDFKNVIACGIGHGSGSVPAQGPLFMAQRKYLIYLLLLNIRFSPGQARLVHKGRHQGRMNHRGFVFSANRMKGGLRPARPAKVVWHLRCVVLAHTDGSLLALRMKLIVQINAVVSPLSATAIRYTASRIADLWHYYLVGQYDTYDVQPILLVARN